MVLVGSHGRGPVGRLLLGSVSEFVVRNAPCPVLVVRPREGAAAQLAGPSPVSVDRAAFQPARSRARLERETFRSSTGASLWIASAIHPASVRSGWNARRSSDPDPAPAIRVQRDATARYFV